MKAPFVFRMRPSMLFSFLAAMFAAHDQADREIDPPQHPGPRKHVVSKKERKRREHIRRINPHRKH